MAVLNRRLFQKTTKKKGKGKGVLSLVEPQGYADGGEVLVGGGGDDRLGGGESGYVAPPVPYYMDEYKDYQRNLAGILPQRNLEAEIAKRKALFAEDDTSGFDKYAALMSYGAQVATTPGGILQALAKPLPNFAGSLSNIANKRADASRLMKREAIQDVEQSESQRRGAMASGLHSAYQNFQALNRQRESQQFQANQAQEDRDWRTQQRADERDYDRTKTPPQTFIDTAQPDKLLPGYLSENGWVGADGNPLPKTAVPADPATVKFLSPKTSSENAMKGSLFEKEDGTQFFGVQVGTQVIDTATQKPVIGKVTPVADPDKGISATPMTIFDKNDPTGLRTVPAYEKNGRFYYREGGVEKEVDAATSLPGQAKDYTVTETNTDKRGGTRTIVREGPNKGTVIHQFTDGTTEITGKPVEEVSKQAQENMKVYPPDVRKQLTVGQISKDGPEGPFVSIKPPSAVGGRAQMSPDEIEQSKTNIKEAENLVNSSEEVIRSIGGGAVGMWPTAKSIIGNATGSVGSDFLVDPKNEASRFALKKWARDVQRVIANNPRFSEGERKLIEDIAGHPEAFFRSPEMSMSLVREITRMTMNDMEQERARIEGRAPMYVDRIPMGTENDPFNAADTRHMEYIQGLRKSGKMPKGGVRIIVNGKTGWVE